MGTNNKYIRRNSNDPGYPPASDYYPVPELPVEPAAPKPSGLEQYPMLLTIAQVAEILGLSAQDADKVCKAEIGTILLAGAQVRVHRKSVEAYLEELATQTRKTQTASAEAEVARQAENWVFVTSSAAVVKWLQSQGRHGRWIPGQASVRDVEGKHVITTGPLSPYLMAQAETITIIYVPNKAPAVRVHDLTEPELHAMHAELQTYQVMEVQTPA